MKRGSRNIGSLIVLGIGGLIAYLFFRGKQSQAIPTLPDGTPFKKATWIPNIPNLRQQDLIELATYPDNPAFGRYVLASHPSQGTTWLMPESLQWFLIPVGEWSVLPYPYSS